MRTRGDGLNAFLHYEVDMRLGGEGWTVGIEGGVLGYQVDKR